MSDLVGYPISWEGKRAYVVGDAMIDLYEFGEVRRMSPEAPVPVFNSTRRDRRMGGAANVQANLEALGLKVESTYARPPWSLKHRYMVGAHQLLRVDEDQQGEIAEELDSMREKLAGADVLVLSDYAKGVLTAQWCHFLIGAARERGIPVVVDPKGTRWDRYIGATAICPNEAEWAAHLNDLTQQTRPVFEAVLIKRGAFGITVLEHHQERRFPARARHVFDVTGAGDTVVATVAAALTAKAPLYAAAQLANVAAAVVVGEVGTSVCTRERLLDELLPVKFA